MEESKKLSAIRYPGGHGCSWQAAPGGGTGAASAALLPGEAALVAVAVLEGLGAAALAGAVQEEAGKPFQNQKPFLINFRLLLFQDGIFRCKHQYRVSAVVRIALKKILNS